jgi:DNA-binding transcriptional MerR regulator/effector-binding domain-containing protein
MLRHYDAIGLLVPDRVDPVTGYRSYAIDQLTRLNRIVALKDLGFTLEQVAAILDEKVSVEELRGMLRLRRAQLRTQITTDLARLGRVEARLRLIEREGIMPEDTIQIKTLPGVRVAELTAVAASFAPESIGPVINPLYMDLGARLGRAGVTPAGNPLAYYEDAPDGEGILVHAALPVAPDATPADVTIVDLPPVERAATIVHRGPMDDVMPTIQTLAQWIDANGYRSTGYNRELYLVLGEDKSTWVTELQEPVVPV